MAVTILGHEDTCNDLWCDGSCVKKVHYLVSDGSHEDYVFDNLEDAINDLYIRYCYFYETMQNCYRTYKTTCEKLARDKSFKFYEFDNKTNTVNKNKYWLAQITEVDASTHPLYQFW